MYSFEISWYQMDMVVSQKGYELREVFHFKGFKYRDDFDKFLKRIQKRKNFVRIYKIIET